MVLCHIILLALIKNDKNCAGTIAPSSSFLKKNNNIRVDSKDRRRDEDVSTVRTVGETRMFVEVVRTIQ
jgi:hypothetical protein